MKLSALRCPRPAALAVITVVVVATTAGALAAQSMSARSLYQALLKKPFAKGELLSGSPAVTPTAGKLSQAVRRYHAIGEVNAAINDVKDGIAYIVYPTAADARAAWLALSRPGLVKQATPGLPQPVRVSTRLVKIKNASGKSTLNRVTQLSFATGNVTVGSFARTPRSVKIGGVYATIALARAALAHLRKVERQPG